MPRRHRVGSGGIVFHVLNRGARRAPLFETSEDYAAFLNVLCEAQERFGMRLLCFALMSNHWHLVVWPAGDGDLSVQMQWLTRTHAQRWHLAQRSVGTGAVYQGRFRAIPVQNDVHFLTLCHYVEHNARRAGLVERAEDWRWSSAWIGHDRCPRPTLWSWPVPRPKNWIEWLNAEGTEQRLEQLRDAIRRQVPFGEADWRKATADCLKMNDGSRRRGRTPASVRGGAR